MATFYHCKFKNVLLSSRLSMDFLLRCLEIIILIVLIQYIHCYYRLFHILVQNVLSLYTRQPIYDTPHFLRPFLSKTLEDSIRVVFDTFSTFFRSYDIQLLLRMDHSKWFTLNRLLQRIFYCIFISL